MTSSGFAGRVLLTIGLVVAVLFGLFLLWQIQDIVILLLIAVIFGAAIRPAVVWLSGRGLPAVPAVLLVYLGLGVVLGLILWLLVPPLVSQARTLIAALPGYMDLAQARLKEFQSGPGIDLPFLPSSGDLAGQAGGLAGGLAGGFAGRALSVGVSVVTIVFSFFLVLVVTLYWTTERLHVFGHWLQLIPAPQRAEVQATWDEIDLKLGAYVRGQLVLGLVIGALSFVALTVLGVPYPLPLAVFAGVTEFIPMVGPFLGAIPAVLIAFGVDPLHAGLVALAYLIIQQLEGNLLVPLVMKRAVGLSPLSVLLSILVGSALLGIVGALLAVPVASIVSIILSHTVFRRADVDPAPPAQQADAVFVGPASAPAEPERRKSA